ncbi:MAG: tRNA N6-adenosine threonylcarbamoyltransferase [Flavobacteriales endosymbiont of Rhyzopertha dominica]|nr:MAG: tRNA (adenosine(37)-N6)-threonylcarbamoyltransferase complex transferase subunit TsaD [Candidatus Shikimatogenerans bostrichidophilus]
MKNNIFNKNIIILGIETSFNDTCSSIILGNKILSNIIITSKIYDKYNGVVPNIASNIQLNNIYNVVSKAILNSNINIREIDGIAFTKGPGLILSLIIGENFAKSMSLILNKPIFGVNHIHAHILSHYIYKKNNNYPNFPYICLSVSGGHSNIYIVKGYFNIICIGKTLDISLGNLFDKLLIMLNLKLSNGYSKLRKFCELGKLKYKIPIPKVNKYNFSFSGIYTYMKNFINKKGIKYINKNKYNIIKSFHYTIYKILLLKINRVIKKYKIYNIAISGGVTNNKYLRKKLNNYYINKNYNFYYLKNNNIINDNAAMIALIGYLKYYNNKFDNLSLKSKSILDIKNL